MEIQLEIEREEARRRRNERKDSYNEELEGLHQMMSQVGRKKEGAPLLVEEFSDDDLDMEGLTALEIDYDEKIVREVNQGIEEITRDLNDIDQINADLGQFTVCQGDTLKTIEEKIQQTDENTSFAVKELGEARKIQSSTRTTKAVLGSAGSCAVAGAVAGAVLGPAGSATGFVAGAVVGGVVGGVSGAGLGYGVGRLLDEGRMVDWEEVDGFNARFLVGVEEVGGCMKCGEEFGLFRDKKHCLSCGGVFCRDCRVKRRVVYGELGKEVRGRVCGLCREGREGEDVVFLAGEESPILKMCREK